MVSGDLLACEADAPTWRICQREHYEPSRLLLTRDATRKRVRSAIEQVAKRRRERLCSCLTYSGHGGQLPTANGDEPDDQDETWCLYDGERSTMS